MIRKLRSSCRTSKNITLEEQYPDLCRLLMNLPNACDQRNDRSKVNSTDSSNERPEDPSVVLSYIFSEGQLTSSADLLRLLALLHRYARENLLLANIYIKDPAVTLIKRDQKIPVIWFVANVGGILGLCMGCSLVTLFEVVHHLVLVFLKTGKRGVTSIQRTIKLSEGGSSVTPTTVTSRLSTAMALSNQANTLMAPAGIFAMSASARSERESEPGTIHWTRLRRTSF